MAAIDTALRSGLAVLDSDSRVVLVLFGVDADETADDWRAQGYTVEPVAVALD